MDCFIVDAFTPRPFAGNQAAVVLIDPADARASDAEWMQAVAADFNLSETAYLVPLGGKGTDTYSLRWFTPAVEVVLCGHATLASAHVLWSTGRSQSRELHFITRQSGTLSATLDAQSHVITIDLPSDPPRLVGPEEEPIGLAEALGVTPVAYGKARDNWLVEVATADEVRNARPDFRAMGVIGTSGCILTAPGGGAVDVISRFFVPSAGIDEDPVTGSAHCALAPWWEDKLGRSPLRCYQASARGGEMTARVEGDRVLLDGKATTVMSGQLHA